MASLEDLGSRLGRVEGKLDLLISLNQDRLNAQGDRISSVEKQVWYGSGAAVVLAFLVTKISKLMIGW